MSKIVKNISGETLSIPNIGTVEADKTVTVPDDFSNPNFEVARVGKPTEEVKEDRAPQIKDDKKR